MIYEKMAKKIHSKVIIMEKQLVFPKSIVLLQRIKISNQSIMKMNEKKRVTFIVNPISGTHGKEAILRTVEEKIDRNQYDYPEPSELKYSIRKSGRRPPAAASGESRIISPSAPILPSAARRPLLRSQMVRMNSPLRQMPTSVPRPSMTTKSLPAPSYL